MIVVKLPYDQVMRTYPDRESPWYESDEVDRDLVDWLEEPGRDLDWDWGFDGDFVCFRFRKPEVAMLFKLTWV